SLTDSRFAAVFPVLSSIWKGELVWGEGPSSIQPYKTTAGASGPTIRPLDLLSRSQPRAEQWDVGMQTPCWEHCWLHGSLWSSNLEINDFGITGIKLAQRLCPPANAVILGL